MDITVHDGVYQPTERDPWIFYDQGKRGLIVVTSDTSFMKSFPYGSHSPGANNGFGIQ